MLQTSERSEIEKCSMRIGIPGSGSVEGKLGALFPLYHTQVGEVL